MGRRSITPEHIIVRDGMRCHYCENMMNIYGSGFPNKHCRSDPNRFTFEHIVPKSQGGTWGLYNLVGACAKCNGAMGNELLKCFCDRCRDARVRNELREMGKA